MTNLEKFINIYKKHLSKSINKIPKTYAWYANDVTIKSADYVILDINNDVLQDSKSVDLTCKELKIKNNLDSIKKYLKI